MGVVKVDSTVGERAVELVADFSGFVVSSLSQVAAVVVVEVVVVTEVVEALLDCVVFCVGVTPTVDMLSVSVST